MIKRFTVLLLTVVLWISTAPLVYADGAEVLLPAEPYSQIQYGPVSGYDLTDIRQRAGVSCTLAGAADILA